MYEYLCMCLGYSSIANSLFVCDKYVTPTGKRLHAGYVQKAEKCKTPFDTTARSKQHVRVGQWRLNTTYYNYFDITVYIQSYFFLVQKKPVYKEHFRTSDADLSFILGSND